MPPLRCTLYTIKNVVINTGSFAILLIPHTRKDCFSESVWARVIHGLSFRLKRARLFALIRMVQMRKIQGKNLRLPSLMRAKQSFVQYRISQNKKFYMAKFNVIRAVATTFKTLTIYMKQYIRIRFLIDKPALNRE